MTEEYVKGSGTGRGGWRGGGRPKGSHTDKTKVFYKKVTEKEFEVLTKFLEEYRKSEELNEKN